jgi:hypothetical protein
MHFLNHPVFYLSSKDRDQGIKKVSDGPEELPAALRLGLAQRRWGRVVGRGKRRHAGEAN